MGHWRISRSKIQKNNIKEMVKWNYNGYTLHEWNLKFVYLRFYTNKYLNKCMCVSLVLTMYILFCFVISNFP